MHASLSPRGTAVRIEPAQHSITGCLGRRESDAQLFL